MLKEDAAPPPQMAGVAGMWGMGGGSGVPNGVMGGIGILRRRWSRLLRRKARRVFPAA